MARLDARLDPCVVADVIVVVDGPTRAAAKAHVIAFFQPHPNLCALCG